MLYYWDDRDGSDFSGWWFGPKVGGDQVWAYQPGKDKTPPETGWKVPYDGSVDENFKVVRKKEKKEKKELREEKAAVAYPGMWYGMPTPALLDPHAAERQMQEYARLQQEETKRRLEEEFQRQKREEQMRREAERKRKEEARKKQEEIRKKREEEMKKQKELQEQRIKEGKAVFLVRKAIQKLEAATPETMEGLQKEMEECLQLHLEDTGSQKGHMKSECDKCMEKTTKRIELLNEAKRKAQEKKEADEKKRLEMETRAKDLLSELSGLLDMADKGVEQLRETAAPMETSDEQSLHEVEACSEAVEAAGADCKALIKTCMDFLVSHGPEMKEPPIVGLSPGTTDLKQRMARCLSRINECTKLSDAVLTAVRAVKDAAARRVVATAKTRSLEELFAKFDVDRDQMLSTSEVRAFAKELGVEISPEAMKQIWRSMVDEQGGVAFSRFPLLKMKLGVEKELVRDRQRKVLREARDKVRATLRAQLDTKVEVVEREVDAMKQAVVKVEGALPPLTEQDRNTLAEADLFSKTDGCKRLIQDARQVALTVQEKIKALPGGFEEKHLEDVKDLLVPDLRVLSKQMGRLDLRLHRVELLCDRFNSEVERRQQAHLYGARLFAVKVARLYAARRGRSIRQLFREMDANGDGEIDSKEFSLFFMSIDRDILEEASAPPELGKAKLPVMPVDFTEDLLAQLFKTVADGGRLSEDVFCRIMRSYGKVVKEGVMTKDLKVTGENAVRKLCVDEVLEVLEGPVEEEELKVPRVKARCISDDSEGWLTIRGNDGTTFLQDWHALFRILRDVPLTANFERPADPSSRVLDIEGEETKMENSELPEGLDKVPRQVGLVEPEVELPAKAAESAAEAAASIIDVNVQTGEVSQVSQVPLEEKVMDEDGDDIFDPESPFEPGDFDFEVEETNIGYQLLQHVDSPEHEDPDEGFRRLRAGEVVEVLEWPNNHLESGLTRMKVLALADDAMGWITQTNADGVLFAEPHS
ncbi:unnamed protein product [Durusdinium trenchii]